MVDLNGVNCLLMTPFDKDGKVDFNSLAVVADDVIKGGVNSVVGNGKIGEFEVLSEITAPSLPLVTIILSILSEEKFKEDSILRPDYWSGFRVVPILIEFWQDMPFRLHDRLEFIKINNKWETKKLFP